MTSDYVLSPLMQMMEPLVLFTQLSKTLCCVGSQLTDTLLTSPHTPPKSRVKDALAR